MTQLYAVPEGSVLTVTEAGDAGTVTSVQTGEATRIVGALTFGPYNSNRDFYVSGGATVSISTPGDDPLEDARSALGLASTNITIHVDATPGRAAFIADGSEAYPFFTLSAAVTEAGTTPYRKIGIKRGSVIRNDQVTLTGAGQSIVAYGSEALPRPQFLGSSAVTVASFTKAGNLYTISSHTYDPKTLALVSPSGVVTKLYMTKLSGQDTAVDPTGTDRSTLTTMQDTGDWTYFPGTHATEANKLKFYSTMDLTGYTVEIPQGGAVSRSGIAFSSTADDCMVEGIDCMFWNNAGLTTDGDATRLIDVRCNYNGGDGADWSQGAKSGYVSGGQYNYNGQRWNAGNGPGDGISAHCGSGVFATLAVFSAQFIGNTQTGLGNQHGCVCTSHGCYFEDNYHDINVYSTAETYGGSHIHDAAIMVHRVNPTLWFNANGSNTTGHGLTTVKLRNPTVYYHSTLGAMTGAAANFQGYNNELTNAVVRYANAVSNAAQIVHTGTGTLTTLVSTNNTFFGQTTVWRVSAGTFINPNTETGRLTTDPLLSSPAVGDVRLQPGSPARASGIAVSGLTADFKGNPFATTPDRGALECA